jgi:demethylmenaquinone methyltransferase / 2-methoxy-6-polyprenyl-1,4-benzoquinol methylase
MMPQLSAQTFPEGKKAYVAGMFDDIAIRYDFLNHFLSFGIDKRWRKQLVNSLNSSQHLNILDCATGTADLAINIAQSISNSKVTGIDISENMLKIGIEKIKQNSLSDRVNLKLGDAENILFEDQTFDAATVAYGVRNYENLNLGLKEMYRVLKTGGKIAILEFSMPESKIFLNLYKFYFRIILPFIGRMISKNFYAYTYLPNSVNDFPDPSTFQAILQQIGFKDVKCKKLTYGVCSLFTGIR